jgi:Flp pilus assembly pilin Flp
MSQRPARRPLSLRRFADDNDGATAIEYGLMVALIALTIFGAISATGQGIRDTLRPDRHGSAEHGEVRISRAA